MQLVCGRSGCYPTREPRSSTRGPCEALTSPSAIGINNEEAPAATFAAFDSHCGFDCRRILGPNNGRYFAIICGTYQLEIFVVRHHCFRTMDKFRQENHKLRIGLVGAQRRLKSVDACIAANFIPLAAFISVLCNPFFNHVVLLQSCCITPPPPPFPSPRASAIAQVPPVPALSRDLFHSDMATA